MIHSSSSAFVTVDWLAEHLNDPQIRILDGSWYLPGAQRDPRQEFLDAHVLGAQFFDIDSSARKDTALPHMLPSAETFSDVLNDLSIGPDDFVVIYDSAGLFSAARVWWTLRVFGHDQVAILKGGLPAWRRANMPVVASESNTASINTSAAQAVWRSEYYAHCADVHQAVTEGTAQIIDARSHGRFMGIEPEPRQDLSSGHIPGSLNIHYNTLIDPEQGCLHDQTTLQQLFDTAGVDLSRPIITSCGSGITACIIALALHELGVDPVAVFDGSWAEWGSTPGLPTANS